MAEVKPKFVKVGNTLYLEGEEEEKVKEKQKREEKSAPALKEEAKPKVAAEGRHFTFEEEAIISDLKIRDTQTHTSEISNIADYDVVSFFISNGLDQPVKFKAFMNKAATTIGSVSVGEEMIIDAQSQKAYTLTPQTSAWLPYLFCEVKCDIAPTNGQLNVKVLKRIPKFELWQTK
jgi:hypothetical protein